MNFEQELKKLKIAIDKELEKQFDAAIRDAKKEDLLMAEALEQTKKITLAGGKRIRGALLCWAYFGASGKDRKKIIKAAAALELLHMFFLVHDDIMDRGDFRHGQKTIHKYFKKKNFAKNDGEHFGASMAIMVGSMLCSMANRIIAEAGFDAGSTISALSEMQLVTATTIIGQSQDIAIAQKKEITEKEVLAMYKNKTAKYSFEGPLHIGAKLAGCKDSKILKSLSNYAIPLGIAFQIQDDILGVFGNEKKFGKSTASDIEEGKQSVMVVRAKKNATAKQKKQIKSILGKKNLSSKEIKVFQNIIESTGALEYSQKMAKRYLSEGKKEIDKIGLNKNAKEFLADLAEYLENREI